MGIDLNEIVKADTYDAKVTRNVNLSGLKQSDSEAALTIGSGMEAAVQENPQAE